MLLIFLTIAANTPRQSRLVSKVRSLRMRACCCTCIGLSLCLTRPFFSTRSSLKSIASSAAAGWWVVASAAPSSCLRREASSQRPPSSTFAPAWREVGMRRLRFLPNMQLSSPATSVTRGLSARAERGNARLLPSACTAGWVGSICSCGAGTAHAGTTLAATDLARICTTTPSTLRRQIHEDARKLGHGPCSEVHPLSPVSKEFHTQIFISADFRRKSCVPQQQRRALTERGGHRQEFSHITYTS